MVECSRKQCLQSSWVGHKLFGLRIPKIVRTSTVTIGSGEYPKTVNISLLFIVFFSEIVTQLPKVIYELGFLCSSCLRSWFNENNLLLRKSFFFPKTKWIKNLSQGPLKYIYRSSKINFSLIHKKTKKKLANVSFGLECNIKTKINPTIFNFPERTKRSTYPKKKRHGKIGQFERYAHTSICWNYLTKLRIYWMEIF